jgi:ribonuclease D
MSIILHKNDLPAQVSIGKSVAIDTETMGLLPGRDRLCLLQLSTGDGTAHIVQFTDTLYAAPRLRAILTDPGVEKIFHFARFDLAILKHVMGITCTPVYCTKIASRLARTYTDKHGYAHVCKDLLGIEINKQLQSSDWGTPDLSAEQLSYAANDVLYLHKIKDGLEAMLIREGRKDLAQQCFDFLPTRAALDLGGWPTDIFEH